MKEMLGKRKGITPIIATSLLIAMVIVIALILFLWFRGLTGEACTKFDGQNVEIVCGDLGYSANYDSGILSISNSGNVPIFSMKVKMVGGSDSQTKDITEIATNWPAFGLSQQKSFTSEDISGWLGGATSIRLTPVLIATCGSKGEKAIMCDESKYGYEIPL